MKNVHAFKNILAMMACIIPCFVDSKPGIVNKFPGGRFGDNLKAYGHARWIAFTHNWDFYYREFEYSDKLAMHTIHKHRFVEPCEKNFVGIEYESEIPADESIAEGTLFMTLGFIGFAPKNRIDYNNPEFLALMKEEIRALEPINKVVLPKDMLSVAVHVRRGGGWDRPLYQEDTLVTGIGPEPSAAYNGRCVDQDYPTRFAPDTFFIDQLRYVLDVYPEKKIYAHIFTDDPSPHLIAQKYERILNNPRLKLGYRMAENSHALNVLDDFFSMAEFEVLIRPSSCFSRMAGHLGRPKLEIWPNKHRWEGRKLIMTEICVQERDKEQIWSSQLTYIKTDK